MSERFEGCPSCLSDDALHGEKGVSTTAALLLASVAENDLVGCVRAFRVKGLGLEFEGSSVSNEFGVRSTLSGEATGSLDWPAGWSSFLCEASIETRVPLPKVAMPGARMEEGREVKEQDPNRGSLFV